MNNIYLLMVIWWLYYIRLSPVFVVKIIIKLKLVKFDFLTSICNWESPVVKLKPLITILDVYFSSSIGFSRGVGHSVFYFFPEERNYKKI